MSVKILTGDCRDVLKTLPDESVHCVVTSPPYYKDFGGSIDECYKAIRERKANGGPGWTDEKQQELL